MEQFTIQVGYTTTRPVIPEQHSAWVILLAKDLTEAKTIAAQWIGSGARLFGPGAVWGREGMAIETEMVTSTTLIDVRI